MRYFAAMEDGRILTITDIQEGKEIYDGINFTLEGTIYKYSIKGWVEEEVNSIFPLFKKPFYKYKPEYNDWFVAEELKCLIALDEEENEELNYSQSTDFNAGIIYTYVEKTAIHMINDKVRQVALTEAVLPKIQLVPKGCSGISEADTLCATMNRVTEHFNAVYGKSFTLEFGSVYTQKQYFHFPYIITRKTECKEMTIAEIEEALGYKIKVVGNK